MALTIDDQFLNDLGLGNMPLEQKAAFIGQLLETLELRVAQRLGDDLSDEQLAEFERITQGPKADEAATEWLKVNNPNYEVIVGEEIERLKHDIGSNLDAVLDKNAV